MKFSFFQKLFCSPHGISLTSGHNEVVFQKKFNKKEVNYHLLLLLKYFGCFILIHILACQKLVAQTTLEKHKFAKSVLDTLFDSKISSREKFDIFEHYNPEIDVYSGKTAVNFARKGIELSNKIDDPFIKGYMLSNLGVIYCNTGLIDSSVFYLEASLLDFEKAKTMAKKAEIHGILRYVYTLANDFESSLKQCYLALEIHKNLGNTIGIGATYNDIAGTLIQTRKYQEALSYAEKGKEILKKDDNIFELVMTTDKIAVCHKELGNIQKALEVSNETIQLATAKPNSLGVEYLTQFYTTRLHLHSSLKKYDLVLKDIKLIRDLFVDLPDHLILNSVDAMEADFYIEQKEYAKAKSIFLNLLNKKDTGLQPNYLYNSLANSYAGLQHYDSAYHFLRAYEEVSLEEKGHETKLKMEELKTQYETEQKEATIALQEKQLSQQRLIQWLTIGFAGVLGLFFFQSYRNSQIRKRNNEELEKTNSLLEKKNKENEILLKEIHHRVKNNLQTISSLLNLQSNSITDQNALDAVQESRNRVASMAIIHQKLYQGENLAAIEMRDYFETIGSAIIQSFGEKGKEVELDIEMPKIELDVDTAIPIGLITNELITNSLKYAFPTSGGGKISIAMNQIENNIFNLKIADNGTPNTSSSINNQGTGFGTLLVQLLTTQLGGEIEKSTTDGTSTVIQFSAKNDAA
ncbi:MAG: histidine kinase dimerization/phosphoacceptor domain -containing protein [Saprospiraceae bacterium]